uniref:UPF0506 domain-containing protein n=1 Tax=Haemonchus placei TaxID=6290 RepID=A0A0N4XAE1_HAEPC
LSNQQKVRSQSHKLLKSSEPSRFRLRRGMVFCLSDKVLICSFQSKCEEWELCYRDSDCHGGKCLGIFVGTCNCNACLDLWLCESDAACGGLKGACNQTTRTCDCLAVTGFPFYVDALHGLCNQKTCTYKDHDERCFGLPCHFGKCQC